MATVRNEAQTRTVNPLRALLESGQAVWLDFIRRHLITSGELERLVAEDGLRGVTSNPSIFEKAIAGSTDYQDVLGSARARELDAKALYEEVAIRDVRDAADILRPVYDASAAGDGYVSLEVSPTLARDTEGTLDEARRLWSTVARPNLMIKVPATPEGIPAIRRLISEGINVNVTLLFAQAVYERVADAFMGGLEDRQKDLQQVASVASFFISRIDTAVDLLLSGKINPSTDPATRGGDREGLTRLLGKAAIANAKITYQRARALYGSPRWKALEARGARPQRLLWASTSTKNPAYRDVLYVEELIGPDTVNTMPPTTLNAFRDHGRVRQSLTENVDGARAALDALARVGISMEAVTDRLLVEGLQQFETAFTQLLTATGQRQETDRTVKINRQTSTLPPDLAAAVRTTLEDWQQGEKVRCLWRGEASLWTDAGESQWIGWLGVTDDQIAHIQHLRAIVEEVRAAGFTHAVLLGMGGSSLCPEVMALTFGRIDGYPELHVLDSTDPAQIGRLERRIDYRRTLFIVSSKSGSTLEPNIFKQYFFDRARRELGDTEAGRRFIAITDPGSSLQRVAESDGFRRVFFGLRNIGGRYSALSDFGMVPAAIIGVDVTRLLSATEEMVHACGATVPVEDNPGVVLGATVGALARLGRDKITIVVSPRIADLGAWLEQLLAESTGKLGHGLIPVDRERLGHPSVYGGDRVFVYLRLESAPDAAQDTSIDALERAGQPVIRVAVEEPYSLGEEFFRWEIATAVAGAVIGINPFDQPDVESAKLAARALTAEYESRGSLPAETPMFESDTIRLYADVKNTEMLTGEVVRQGSRALSLAAYLAAHLNRLRAGDYFALLAFVEMSEAHEAALQRIRHAVRDAKRVATCLGFGPRFLHSTGQAYKGGPDTGVFLQITCDDAVDLPVPGQRYTFGVVKAAQARGDFQVLADRGRRALRAHLGRDVEAGLRSLADAVTRALALA